MRLYIFMMPVTGGTATATVALRDFRVELLVWATVLSRFDSRPPLVWDDPTTTYERASDEHSRLAVSAATSGSDAATRSA